MRVTLQAGVVAEQAADQTVDYVMPGDGEVTVTRERPAGAGDELAVKVSGSRVTVSGGIAGARYCLTRGDQPYRIRFVPKGTVVATGQDVKPSTAMPQKAQPKAARRW